MNDADNEIFSQVRVNRVQDVRKVSARAENLVLCEYHRQMTVTEKDLHVLRADTNLGSSLFLASQRETTFFTKILYDTILNSTLQTLDNQTRVQLPVGSQDNTGLPYGTTTDHISVFMV